MNQLPHHLLRLADLSVSQVASILKIARARDQVFARYMDSLKGKIVGSLFLSESMRTASSFRSATLRLGGNTIDFGSLSESSDTNRRCESPEDFIRTAQYYCDAMIVRSRDATFVNRMENLATIPLISAGHGQEEHPTTGLGQRLALEASMGALDEKTILIIARLPKRGINSFIASLRDVNALHLLLLTPEGTKLTPDYEELARLSNLQITYVRTYEDVLPSLDRVDAVYVDDHPNDGMLDGGIPGLNIEDFYQRLSPKVCLTAGFPRTALTPPDYEKRLQSIMLEKSRYALFCRAASLIWLLDQNT